MTKKYHLLFFCGFAPFFFAEAKSIRPARVTILAALDLLEEANIKILEGDTELNLGLAQVSSLQESLLSRKSHERGHCGGYEVLSGEDAVEPHFFTHTVNNLKALQVKKKNLLAEKMVARPAVQKAIDEVDPKQIEAWVKWLSSYRTRYESGAAPNEHVVALQSKLQEIVGKFPSAKSEVLLMDHTSTSQKTIRVRLPGATLPNQIVAAGAHLDSINWGFFGPTKKAAPGADDDASGVADLLEALRLILPRRPACPYGGFIFLCWRRKGPAGFVGDCQKL